MKYQRRLHHHFLVTTFSLALMSVASFSVFSSEFSNSYSAYQAAISSKNYVNAEKYAEQTYQLGASIYPKESITQANLAMNWGSVLRRNGKKAEAFAAYSEALMIYQKHFNDNAIDLLDPLLGVAETTEDNKLAKNTFNNAIDIIEDVDNPVLLADTLMAAFNHLSQTSLYSRKIQRYAIEALEIYQDNLPGNSMSRVKATYAVGLIRKSKKQNSQAIELLNEVVKQFSVLDYSHPYELASHAHLVELYEQAGQSDESTQHCIAIGRMRPWTDTQDQLPLYRSEPKYPRNLGRSGKDGMVQLSFIVDESGFVTQPKIITSVGGSGFEKASLRAIKQWRYAPKFVDGKPVAAQSEVQIDYTL